MRLVFSVPLDAGTMALGSAGGHCSVGGGSGYCSCLDYQLTIDVLLGQTIQVDV